MGLDFLFIGSVFLAGVLIFFAPCTVSLIPAYLGYLSGVAEEELRSGAAPRSARRKVLYTTVSFVLGFSLVFISLGVLAGVAGHAVAPAKEIVSKVSGALMIVLGLLMAGVIRPQLLVRERRVRARAWFGAGNPVASFFVGTAFAVGWTPCIGPVLGTVLLLAGQHDTALEGAFLLAVFSLGFGLPFLLLGLAFARAARTIDRMSHLFRYVSILGGLLLVALGFLLLTGSFTFIGQLMYRIVDFADYEQMLMRFL